MLQTTFRVRRLWVLFGGFLLLHYAVATAQHGELERFTKYPPWPPVFLIGGMRCGATTLASYLTVHPKIIGSRPSSHSDQPHFFDNPATYSRGTRWYMNTPFDPSTPFGTVQVDATGTYFHSLEAPVRIKNTFPSISLRFVLVLRDPVDRAASHWHDTQQQSKQKSGSRFQSRVRGYRTLGGLVTQSLKIEDGKVQTRRRKLHDIIANGEYDVFMGRWLRIFPADHFCIVDYRLLKTHRSDLLSAVTEFLGLSPLEWNSAALPRMQKRKNIVRMAALDNPTKNLLRRFYKERGMQTMKAVQRHGMLGCGIKENVVHLENLKQALLPPSSSSSSSPVKPR